MLIRRKSPARKELEEAFQNDSDDDDDDDDSKYLNMNEEDGAYCVVNFVVVRDRLCTFCRRRMGRGLGVRRAAREREPAPTGEEREASQGRGTLG